MAASPPVPPPPAPPLRPSALVGQERERQRLGALLAAAAGEGRLVLIGGAAGIGKTALVRALAAAAAAHGAAVPIGRCYDLSATPPYGT